MLLCESTFRDVDRIEAWNKKHLTTRQAALIAAMIGAKSSRIFHVSNLYTGHIPEVLAEFHGFVKDFQSLTSTDLETAVENELVAASTSR
jgi:ribonuclease BN (tRNA processing enzyme)